MEVMKSVEFNERGVVVSPDTWPIFEDLSKELEHLTSTPLFYAVADKFYKREQDLFASW